MWTRPSRASPTGADDDGGAEPDGDGRRRPSVASLGRERDGDVGGIAGEVRRWSAAWGKVDGSRSPPPRPGTGQRWWPIGWEVDGPPWLYEPVSRCSPSLLTTSREPISRHSTSQGTPEGCAPPTSASERDGPRPRRPAELLVTGSPPSGRWPVPCHWGLWEMLKGQAVAGGGSVTSIRLDGRREAAERERGAADPWTQGPRFTGCPSTWAEQGWATTSMLSPRSVRARDRHAASRPVGHATPTCEEAGK